MLRPYINIVHNIWSTISDDSSIEVSWRVLVSSAGAEGQLAVVELNLNRISVDKSFLVMKTQTNHVMVRHAQLVNIVRLRRYPLPQQWQCPRRDDAVEFSTRTTFNASYRSAADWRPCTEKCSNRRCLTSRLSSIGSVRIMTPSIGWSTLCLTSHSIYRLPIPTAACTEEQDSIL